MLAFSEKVQRRELCQWADIYIRYHSELYPWRERPHLTKDGTGGELFLSMRGKGISRKMVWVLVKEYAKRAGIEKNVTPHGLRHSFATHLLMEERMSGPSREMLGHAILERLKFIPK